ncbi:unnamed protein product [Adineta ricciae]|uniref:Uncharacterized protein n=2 Tax=Adineta ricciae TaxID=249248 RepID=A0A815UXI6_ADIRI|nr:unnamed protein product [Adineta ricciae]
MTTSSSIPYDYQQANPLLYTFRDYHTGIQPYFILPVQFLIFDLTLRFWDRFMYGTWLLPSEFIEVSADEKVGIPPSPGPLLSPLPSPRVRVIFFPQRQNIFSLSTIFFAQDYKKLSVKTKKAKHIPIFDLYDLLVSVTPLLAHAIWYCIIQSNCMSGENATTWNCYNLFGYRIYNYIFSPFAVFSFNFLSKLILAIQKRRQKVSLFQRKQKWRRIAVMIIFFITLTLSILTFLFVGALVLPFFFTNTLPMVIIYAFIAMTYLYILIAINIFLKFYTVVTGKAFSLGDENLNWIKRQMKKLHNHRPLVMQAGVRLFPYLLSILFNLSQFLYYGSDYLGAMSREAQKRDPTAYFGRVQNSSQIAHTILSST